LEIIIEYFKILVRTHGYNSPWMIRNR